MEPESKPRLRWRTVIQTVVPVSVVAIVVAGLWAFSYWNPFFPRELGRRITEGFLRAFLIGYAAILVLVLTGIAGLSWALWRSRARRPRRLVLVRGLLLCVSGLIGVMTLEASAGIWLAWAHRLPTLPTRFPESSRDEISLVVIGGSSALGYPYYPIFCTISAGEIVARELPRAWPGRRVAIDNRAKLGATLEDMHQGLATLKRRPDVMIIYSGNNEFLARFDGSRNANLSEAPIDRWLNRLYRASLSSWLCRMTYETINKYRLGGPPPKVSRHHLIDPPLCTPSEYAAILADFRRRLDAIVAYCHRIGAEPVLVIPPGNEAGVEPNRSVLPDTVSPAERAALTAAFDAAHALEETDPARSIAGYQSIVARQPQFAEAHFRLGRLFEKAGDWPRAGRSYVAARDCDGFPVRCTTPFQQAYRDVAARYDTILIDGPAVLRAISPHGLLDDHLFHDAHHPALVSQIALAQAIVDQLRARRVFGVTRDGPSTIDPAECVAHFHVDQTVWVSVCARTSTFYRDYFSARFDPSERLSKMKRYEEAGHKIAAGMAPEQTGVPGLGLKFMP